MPMPLPKGVSRQQWERVRNRTIEAANGVCRYCSEPLNPTAPRYAWDSTEIDHIVPRHAVRHLSEAAQRADFLDPANLVAIHRRCNAQKSDNTAPEMVGAQSREW